MEDRRVDFEREALMHLDALRFAWATRGRRIARPSTAAT
jgi:hypothetical protein